MQAAQWGWLHSIPEKHKDTRLRMYGGPVGIEETEGQYLLDALFEVGPTEWRKGEEGPISWSELWGYAQATVDIVEAWEIKAVMRMSRAYYQAKQEGRDVHCIAPVDRDEIDD